MDLQVNMEDAYRSRSAELRALASHMSGDLRDTILDVADHWETLAQQAGQVARSKKLINDWESAKLRA
ncbi:MAG: hypothetical protein AB7E79_15485 [Rhodospirillaceae bacterium]